MPPRRWIAHLDMDAFYASVELLRYPELAGMPVVIGGGRRHQPERLADGTRRFATLAGYAGRGVITTATYAARDLGVHSGMGLMKAALRAPQAVLLPVDHEQYRLYSRRFKAAVAEVAPVIEDRGIDEIYIDLSEQPGAQEAVAHDPHGGVRAIALDIKNNVKRATGLNCSIGITPNKLLSKIASDLDKPDGLTLLTMADLESRIWPLPVRRINGIGPKAGARLAALGIATVGQLAQQERAWLVQQFGRSYGAWLHDAAHGVDERPVVTFSEPVSMSRETTFDRDLHARRDKAELGAIFTQLAEQVANDLQRKGYVGRTIGIKLRFEDFKTVTRDMTVDDPTAEAATIRLAAGLCLKRVDLARRIRLLGVRVGTLQRAPGAGPARPIGATPAPSGETPGIIALGCHRHGSMRGHVLVSSTPWAAVTDDKGRVTLAQVPDGALELRVWHPEQLSDQAAARLQLAGSQSAEARLNFTPKRRSAAPASRNPDYPD